MDECGEQDHQLQLPIAHPVVDRYVDSASSWNNTTVPNQSTHPFNPLSRIPAWPEFPASIDESRSAFNLPLFTPFPPHFHPFPPPQTTQYLSLLATSPNILYSDFCLRDLYRQFCFSNVVSILLVLRQGHQTLVHNGASFISLSSRRAR